jgi:AraC-like DNA-binding protein
VILKTKVNFAEYRGFVYPLSYLMEQAVIDKAKKAYSFDERVELLSEYFRSIIEKYSDSGGPIRIVSEIIQHCDKKNDFTTPAEDFAAKCNISSRTLQRYFETTTSLSIKKALQIMRIRKAVESLVKSPSDFNYAIYGYYDHSHFYKHLRQFLKKETLKNLQPHLKLLSKLHKSGQLAVGS